MTDIKDSDPYYPLYKSLQPFKLIAKMKATLVFFCLFSLALGIDPEMLEQIKASVHQLAQQCQAKTGVQDDEITVLKSHNLPTTQSGRCFLACMYKVLGFQDQNGLVDVEGSRAAVEKVKPLDEELYNKMIQVFNVCREAKNGAEECETAWNIIVCVKEANEKFGITEPLGY